MKRILSLLLALLATSAMGADLRSAGIKGATTSTPCPGCVGEVKTVRNNTGTSCSSGLYTSVVSESLTTGTWLVVTNLYANVFTGMTGLTVHFLVNAVNNSNYGQDLTAANLPFVNGDSIPIGLGPQIVTVPSTETVDAQVSPSGGSATVYGFIQAVRIY